MRRLNIFVDETGEFGFGDGSSDLYGISFTFHEQKDDIRSELNILNNRLEKIGYTGMIHMADLVMRRGDYRHFSLEKRKNIFYAIYQFSRRITVKYCTIVIDKRYINTSNVLKRKLSYEIDKMILEHEKYFNRFNKIVLYYDNGQGVLGTLLESAFSKFNSFEHRIEFDHIEKRLFQVSDMLTYVDKYDYKYKNKMSFAKGEKYFFSYEEMRKILKELYKKRF